MTETTNSPTSLGSEIGQSKPFQSPEQELCLNLLRSSDLAHFQLSQFFKLHELSHPLYNVMRILNGAGAEGLPSQQIAAHLINRVPDVTRLVDRLERLGYVLRVPCERDRRIVWVRLTEAGRAKAEELRRPLLKLHRAQFGHLGERKIQLLNRLLSEARHPAAASDPQVSQNLKQISIGDKSNESTTE